MRCLRQIPGKYSWLAKSGASFAEVEWERKRWENTCASQIPISYFFTPNA